MKLSLAAIAVLFVFSSAVAMPEIATANHVRMVASTGASVVADNATNLPINRCPNLFEPTGPATTPTLTAMMDKVCGKGCQLIQWGNGKMECLCEPPPEDKKGEEKEKEKKDKGEKKN